jgi:hypothetical protein
VKRGLAGGIVVLMLFAVLSSLASSPASAAPAQDTAACFPGTDPDYPPTGNNGTLEPLVLVSGVFNPGASGTVVIGGAVPGDTYCGFLFSTPVTLVPRVADAQGRLTWPVAVPADFKLVAMHHIDVYKEQSKVGNFDFCVGASGTIVATSTCSPSQQVTSTTKTTTQVQANTDTKASSGKLPRTGSDLFGLLQVALLAIGLGAWTLYVRRRRVNRFATE